MPTTSNFGWTTPADTDLVKDGASAIRTLGNGIDTSFVDLKGGTTGQVLSKASNTDLDFSWVAADDTNAIQNALLTTTGDTIYASSASTPARLGIGSTGQVLTVSGGVPTWATPAGGGKVLQVVQATYSTETGVSNNTWTDTGLSASITPASSSNKVLVMVSLGSCGKPQSAASAMGVRIQRASTTIVEVGGMMRTGTNTAGGIAWTYAYLDSPATTSSTTYKPQFNNSSNDGGSVYVQYSNQISTILLLEIGA